MKDSAYRTYVQAPCTGKTHVPTFEEFQAGVHAEVREQKIVPAFVRPVFVSYDGGDALAANAVARFVEQKYRGQVDAHNLAIDEEKQLRGGGSSLLVLATDLKLLCNKQIETPLYKQPIKNTGMTRQQFDASLDQMGSTYRSTKDQTGWSRITETVVVGTMTFGITALPLLDKDQRIKNGVKEGAVLIQLKAINTDLRSANVKAQ